MDFFDNPYTDSREPSGYDTAQFCINGHCITSCADTSPEFTQSFCSTCGAKTTKTCPGCQAKIRGYFHIPNVFGSVDIRTPGYCHNCGQAYPWTAASLDAAKQLTDELDELTPEDRITLKGALDDLVRETPRSQVAIVRFKKILPKAGKVAAEAFKKLLIDVVTEAAKKQLWP
jgi:hypothetical protein